MHFLDGLGNLNLFQMENKRRTRLDVMRDIQAEFLVNNDHFSKFIPFRITLVLYTSITTKTSINSNIMQKWFLRLFSLQAKFKQKDGERFTEAITKLEVCLYSFQQVLNELITFLGCIFCFQFCILNPIQNFLIKWFIVQTALFSWL